ncbi:TIGR00270 family protein [Candidatus Woesearchaeota archaeon]|nr:TIGR00270 family protein [Candidatus Woesearchaeota archaeon]
MCDMCSSEDKVYRIELEGSMLNVCEKCASFGRVIGKIRPEEAPKQKKRQEQKAKEELSLAKARKETETIQMIVPSYPELIRKSREKMGLKQEDFAKKLNEKESVIQKLESGIMKPSIDLARKLERFLKVRLVDEIEVEAGSTGMKAKGSEGLTIGDLINIKKR